MCGSPDLKFLSESWNFRKCGCGIMTSVCIKPDIMIQMEEFLKISALNPQDYSQNKI